MSWTDKDKKAMAHAKFIAQQYSKDRSTKVGCLIVAPDYSPLSWGYNGFPRGANDSKDERHERPIKYLWAEHAERNAFYNAARNGTKLLGARLYVTSLCPCTDCARGAIQCGIGTICLERSAFDTDNPRAKAWLEGWAVTKEILDECGVEVIVEKSEEEIAFEEDENFKRLKRSMEACGFKHPI